MATAATEVDFVKLSPTQNMTVLVTSRHAVADYRSIAAQLLSAGHLQAEQVGFVRSATTTGAQVRLHMAGDEFCGNACMALAALTAAQLGLGVDDRTDVTLEASGAEAPLTCRVERRDASYQCELTMPLPSAVEPYLFPGVDAGRSALVRYPDAVHLVVESGRHDQALRDRAQEVAARLAATAGVPVVGVMLYDRARQELAPLVNVPSLDSMVWERSCGSGTASVGAYLAATSGVPVRTNVHQPGGTMHVRAGHGDRGVTDLRISGQVRVVAEGTAYVHG
jgi:diaminopimelate epimerase